MVSHDALVRIEARLSRIESAIKALTHLVAEEPIAGQSFPDANLGVY